MMKLATGRMGEGWVQKKSKKKTGSKGESVKILYSRQRTSDRDEGVLEAASKGTSESVRFVNWGLQQNERKTSAVGVLWGGGGKYRRNPVYMPGVNGLLRYESPVGTT